MVERGGAERGRKEGRREKKKEGIGGERRKKGRIENKNKDM